LWKTAQKLSIGDRVHRQSPLPAVTQFGTVEREFYLRFLTGLNSFLGITNSVLPIRE
jgi:hypothetical protein